MRRARPPARAPRAHVLMSCRPAQTQTAAPCVRSPVCVTDVRCWLCPLVCERPVVTAEADKTAGLHTYTHKQTHNTHTEAFPEDLYKLCCEAWGTSITKTPVVQNPWS